MTNKPKDEVGMSNVRESPNYIGMGMLSIPVSIREALYHWENARQQAKKQYGYHRENMLIDADNKLVLAIEEYTLEQVKAAVDSHTAKIKQQINNSQRVDAIDLTVDLIKLSQVEQAGEALKQSIIEYLTKATEPVLGGEVEANTKVNPKASS